MWGWATTVFFPSPKLSKTKRKGKEKEGYNTLKCGVTFNDM